MVYKISSFKIEIFFFFLAQSSKHVAFQLCFTQLSMDLSGVAGDGHALTVLSSPVTRWPNRISRQELKKSHIDEGREPVCHTYACSSLCPC